MWELLEGIFEVYRSYGVILLIIILINMPFFKSIDAFIGRFGLSFISWNTVFFIMAAVFGVVGIFLLKENIFFIASTTWTLLVLTFVVGVKFFRTRGEHAKISNFIIILSNSVGIYGYLYLRIFYVFLSRKH